MRTRLDEVLYQRGSVVGAIKDQGANYIQNVCSRFDNFVESVKTNDFLTRRNGHDTTTTLDQLPLYIDEMRARLTKVFEQKRPVSKVLFDKGVNAYRRVCSTVNEAIKFAQERVIYEGPPTEPSAVERTFSSGDLTRHMENRLAEVRKKRVSVVDVSLEYCIDSATNFAAGVCLEIGDYIEFRKQKGFFPRTTKVWSGIMHDLTKNRIPKTRYRKTEHHKNFSDYILPAISAAGLFVLGLFGRDYLINSGGLSMDAQMMDKAAAMANARRSSSSANLEEEFLPLNSPVSQYTTAFDVWRAVHFGADSQIGREHLTQPSGISLGEIVQQPGLEHTTITGTIEEPVTSLLAEQAYMNPDGPLVVFKLEAVDPSGKIIAVSHSAYKNGGLEDVTIKVNNEHPIGHVKSSVNIGGEFIRVASLEFESDGQIRSVNREDNFAYIGGEGGDPLFKIPATSSSDAVTQTKKENVVPLAEKSLKNLP
ncbi:hypothetical protein CL622_00110 [archaeon]|nr:hypothetical protein [archaeon]